MGGVMSATGEKGGPPLKAGVPVADFMAGAHLYAGVLSALVGRARTGRGRVVEVSMLEALFATLLPSAGHSYQTNEVPARSGNRHVADSYVPFDAFRASDGWVTIVCATDEHWLKLTDAMGRPDLRADQGLRELAGRIERIEEVTAAVTEWSSTLTRAEITAACQDAEVAAAPLRDVMEVLTDPHLRARGFLTEVQTPGGLVALPNSPIRYDGSPLRELTPPPDLGQDTDEVLSRLCGLDELTLKDLRAGGVIGG
jgi:crotonobetainyl-CoA:carnitine CoA-transferase CaiB-like acyl-CoA transferase